MRSNIYTIKGQVIITIMNTKEGKNGIFRIDGLFAIRPTGNCQTIMAFHLRKETSSYIKSVDVENIVEVIFYPQFEKTQEGWSYKLIALAHTVLKRK